MRSQQASCTTEFCYHLHIGTKPILISMPHDGSLFPEAIGQQFLPNALRAQDTDWFMHKLYDFAKEMGCSLLIPKFSRYVIDLNRSTDGLNLYPGQNTTELCPLSSFDFSPLYPADKQPNTEEIQRRITHYWMPYHQALKDELKRLRELFPSVLLFEAHSIASKVPRFFEGILPDFNFGTNDGKSCDEALLNIMLNKIDFKNYSKIVNGRFKGGYITRHYGKPHTGIQAIQLELSQATYMDEIKPMELSNQLPSWNESKASQVKTVLESLILSAVERLWVQFL